MVTLNQAENAILKELLATLESLLLERERKLPDSFSIDCMKNLHEQYVKRIKEERITILQIRPHNERGAGRKHRATSEQREYIISLSYQGISQNKIAGIISNQTGEKWNRTTIRNIIIVAKN